jgi:hypothetical protein
MPVSAQTKKYARRSTNEQINTLTRYSAIAAERSLARDFVYTSGGKGQLQ